MPHRHGALEALEDALGVLRRDADALVAHLEPGVGAVAVDGDLDALAGAVLHGVGQQVAHHLLQAHGVPAADDEALGAHLQGTLGALQRLAGALDDAAHQAHQVHLLELAEELALRDAGDVEQLVDELAEALRLEVGGLQLGGDALGRQRAAWTGAPGT